MDLPPPETVNAHASPGGPLDGIRVLDLTRFIAGPLCGQLLSDAGAEVIKVEPPEGEASRHEWPRVRIDEDHETSLLFLRFNRGKKSVVIDTRSEQGVTEFAELIATADVLIDNFRPGMLESWGLDWERLQEINPRLIYATITGFGYERSPLRDLPVFSTIAEAMGGLVSRRPTDDTPPEAMGLPVADEVSGLFSTIGILQALIQRGRTGVGSRLDLAMYDSVLTFNDIVVAQAATTPPGEEGRPPRKIHAPAGFYRAADGWMAISVGTRRHWDQLCRIAGWDDWLESGLLDDSGDRVREHDRLIGPRLNEWLSTRMRWEVSRELALAGIPAGPLQSGFDILGDEQARSRGTLVDYETLDGPITLVGNPFGFVDGPQRSTTDFPRAGQHTSDFVARRARPADG